MLQRLDGPLALAEGLGDLGGGAPLEGEEDGLVAEPHPLGRDGLGQVLEFVERQVVVDVHGEAPGVGTEEPHLDRKLIPAEHLCTKFLGNV